MTRVTPVPARGVAEQLAAAIAAALDADKDAVLQIVSDTLPAGGGRPNGGGAPRPQPSATP